VISALSPVFLAAGLALATAPIVLHLLARRPPERQPLPTARFLREDARTLLRLQKRPTDLRLLSVRIAFALALGASFAGMTWTPDRAEAGRVVLLDAGADALSDWGVARTLARDAAVEAERSIIIAYGVAEGVRIVTPEGLAGLERGTRSANAEDGLRALRGGVLSETRFASVDVTWVTRPSWSAWTTGVGLLRPVLWPGRTTLIAIPEISRADSTSTAVETLASRTRTAQVMGPVDDMDPLPRALRALGVRVTSSDEGSRLTSDWSFAETPTSDEISVLVERAREGSTVVLSGRLPRPISDVPWVPADAVPYEPTGLALTSGMTLGSSITREGGTPATGAHVIAVFEDATIAAVSTRVDAGCLVYLAASLMDPQLTESSDYPSLVDVLGNGCAGVDGVEGPLDRGALHALERPDLAAFVDVASLAASEGYALTRWLVVLVLLLLGLEVALTRERHV